jgi:Integral membrane protein TerC family
VPCHAGDRWHNRTCFRVGTRLLDQWSPAPLGAGPRLLAIGSSDLLFAFDSIPAVFGVTDHAYIVFAANAFALLGLRPLLFLVSGLLDRLVYMPTGLAVILAFINVKLVLEFAHGQHHAIPEISTVTSPAVILVVLTVTTVASIVRARHDPIVRAHLGSLRHRPVSRADRFAGVQPAGDRGYAENRARDAPAGNAHDPSSGPT